MRIQFTDKSDGVWFEHSNTNSGINRFSKKSKYKINSTGLLLYGIYRNSIYDSYVKKEDIADDIKSNTVAYEENQGSFFINSRLYNDPIYHYAVKASTSTVSELLQSNGQMKCFFACKNIEAKRKIVGFVHYIEKIIDGEPCVYISQAGVTHQSTGIGRRLMECVLSNYSAGTKFYIVTRIFNQEAIFLYSNRLAFTPISRDGVAHLGYDERYCGFQHTTTDAEISEIKDRQIEFNDEEEFSHLTLNDSKIRI